MTSAPAATSSALSFASAAVAARVTIGIPAAQVWGDIHRIFVTEATSSQAARVPCRRQATAKDPHLGTCVPHRQHRRSVATRMCGGGGCRKGVSGGYPDVGYMARRSTSLDWTSAGNWQPRAASLNPRQLTVELSKARALPELLSLQQRHGEHFNSLHVGAFWCKFKKLPRGNLGALDHLLASVCEQTFRMLPELDARNVTSVAHAFAKAGLVGTGPWQNVYIYIYIYNIYI